MLQARVPVPTIVSPPVGTAYYSGPSTPCPRRRLRLFKRPVKRGANGCAARTSGLSRAADQAGRLTFSAIRGIGSDATAWTRTASNVAISLAHLPARRRKTVASRMRFPRHLTFRIPVSLALNTASSPATCASTLCLPVRFPAAPTN